VISLGVGDTTQPLPDIIVSSMAKVFYLNPHLFCICHSRKNQLAKAGEFEYEMSELERICKPFIMNQAQEADQQYVVQVDQKHKKMIEKKVKKAEKAIPEDREHQKKVEARKVLENCAYYMRYRIREVKNALAKAEDEIEQTFRSLDRNQFVEAQEFENRTKELEGICYPFMAKMYQ